MNTLKQDAQAMISIQTEYERLNNYAIKCYNNSFGTIGGLHFYKTFEIINPNEIKIIYGYGEGVVIKQDSFITDII